MLVLMGVIKDNGELKGYVFYNTDGNVTQKVLTVDVHSIKTYYNGSTMVGVKLNKDGLLETTECNINRFATFNSKLKSNDLKSKLYILRVITKGSEKVYELLHNYEVKAITLKQLLSLIDRGYTLINGKVVTKGGKTYISAIKGSYAYMELQEKKGGNVTKIVEDEVASTLKVDEKENEIKVNKDDMLDCIAYSLMVINRWLQKLSNYEDLGRMFINYDMFLTYSDDVRVVKAFKERNLDSSLLNIDTLKTCKDRITLITTLALYKEVLVDILSRIDIKGLQHLTYSKISTILKDRGAVNYIKNNLYSETDSNLDVNTLVNKILKHNGINNHAYLYYLTVLGSIARDISDYEKFLRIYSFGQSLNETVEPMVYKDINDIGYIFSQAILLGYGNLLGLVDGEKVD